MNLATSVKNGKWQAKLDGVNNEIKRKNYDTYFLIFPENYDDMISDILGKI